MMAKAGSTIRVGILTTGGTIEKTYDESDGMLRNVGSVLGKILSHLRLPGLTVRHVSVMSKDSLEMTDEDRRAILAAVTESLFLDDAVLVIHGTDTLTLTGDFLHANLKELSKPVVLTGAMRPYEFRDTDANQNVTESLLACRFAPPGVYAVMHNQILSFPGLVKDRERLTFRYLDGTGPEKT
jgi:L-asparaginase